MPIFYKEDLRGEISFFKIIQKAFKNNSYVSPFKKCQIDQTDMWFLLNSINDHHMRYDGIFVAYVPLCA